MKPFFVVKHFYIVEYVPPRFGNGFVFFVMNQFGLKRAEEALGYGVVPAIALAAHRLLETEYGAYTLNEALSTKTFHIRLS